MHSHSMTKVYWGKELLVVGAIPAGDPIVEGETVQVTGPVRKFVAAEIERLRF